MQIITADIRNEVQLLKALNGVDVIIHCAALIDVSLFPDESELQSINVEGMDDRKSMYFLSYFNVTFLLLLLGQKTKSDSKIN